MNDRYEECELGRDVTHLFRSHKKGVAIVRVRLDASDIAKLEAIGRENGKLVTEVIRDAIAAYQVEQTAAPVQR